MDASYAPRSSSQEPSDYLPQWLDPVLDRDQAAFVRAGKQTENRSDEPDHGNLQFLRPVPQGHDSNHFQPPDLLAPAGEYPCFYSHGHVQQLQDDIPNQIHDENGASSSIIADHGAVSGETAADSLGRSRPIPIPPKYSKAYHAPYRDIPDLSTSLASSGSNGDITDSYYLLDSDVPELSTSLESELSLDFSVQLPASYERPCPVNELSTSVPEHTTNHRGTNSYFSHSEISQPSVSSYSLSSSPPESSSLDPVTASGASWGQIFVWDPKSGKEVQDRGVKRRSDEEKKSIAKLRALGGACQKCRRRHQKCNHRSEGDLAHFKERQPPDFRTSKSSEIRNLSRENFTGNLISGTSSRQRVSQPNISQNDRPWATDPLMVQAGDAAFDSFAIDDIGNMGFQFRSVQYPNPTLDPEGDDLLDIANYMPGRLSQCQYNAMQLEGQCPPSVRGQNAGLENIPYFSNLPAYNRKQATENGDSVLYISEDSEFRESHTYEWSLTMPNDIQPN